MRSGEGATRTSAHGGKRIPKLTSHPIAWLKVERSRHGSRIGIAALPPLAETESAFYESRPWLCGARRAFHLFAHETYRTLTQR
jgi:hypothetical protein